MYLYFLGHSQVLQFVLASVQEHARVLESQMDPTIFVATMRSWVEAMESQQYAHAYRRSLDLYAVGHPLAKGLPLADQEFGLDGWRNKKPEELLEGLVGFVLAVSTEAAVIRDRKDAPR